jgi:hypothetical protein
LTTSGNHVAAGTGYGYGSGSGSGSGDGDGDGYGSGIVGVGYDLNIAGELIRIGCQTHTIAEWLGDIGSDMADMYDISEINRAIYRAQIDALR